MRTYEPTQRPQNEISWENRAEFADIKVGDRVWLGRNDYPCSGGIGTVTRLTATLIILGKGGDYDRYKRESGYMRGGSFMSNHITGVATPEEIKQWEAEEQRKKAEEQRRTDLRDQVEATKKELAALFADASAYVSESYKSSDQATLFSVTFFNLDAETVRTVAPTLKAIFQGVK